MMALVDILDRAGALGIAPTSLQVCSGSKPFECFAYLKPFTPMRADDVAKQGLFSPLLSRFCGIFLLPAIGLAAAKLWAIRT